MLSDLDLQPESPACRAAGLLVLLAVCLEIPGAVPLLVLLVVCLCMPAVPLDVPLTVLVVVFVDRGADTGS